MVFLDPDNGMNPASVEKHHSDSRKYVYADEIAPFIGRGQSVVVYQHATRERPGELIARTLRRLRTISLSEIGPFALRHKAGTSRAYFVLPSRKNRPILRARAESAVRGKWQSLFEPKVYD